ncbi:ATP-binding cassette domain-containing protein [Helcococcus sueciensis]|uniref:ATP-binding cassette domain-containing protein n=1 Tax=Helcococcus sueciensis TaxID=241555 RepID=UPI00042A818B|nr:ABC transporter ATP-binding protein [Helcococcus sueciensis]
MIFKKFFRKNILLIFKILLFTFISISFISLIPVFTKMIIDNYKNLSKNTIIIYSLGYALSIILYLLFELLKKINLNRLKKEYGVFIKHNIFKSITLMDHIDINSKKKGEYINNLTKDIDTVYENYILCSIQLLISLVTAAVYLIYMINMNLFLSVIIIIASFIGFFIPRITGDKINIKRKNFSDKNGEFIELTSDLLNASELFNKDTSKKFLKTFDENNEIYEDMQLDLANYISYTNILSGLSLYFINIVTFVCGIIFISLGYISMSSLIAIIAYIDLIVIPIRDLIYQVITIKSSRKLIEKFEFYFNDKSKNRETIDEFKYMRIKNLNYTKDKFSLNDINMIFNKSCKYAIVGDNGSGKSTLAKLISLELKPNEQEIFINGVDILDLDISDLIFYSSSAIVFKGSVLDNINISNKNNLVDKEYIKIVDDFSDRNIEYFGNNFSFGQKAKIALSRALNSDKEIIILDEIFANVDEKSELELTKKLIESEKTVILITHNRDNEYLDLFDEVIQIHKEIL